MVILLGVRHIVKPDLSKYPYFRGPIENYSLLPNQGFSNENYSFRADDQKYLLRKFKDQTIDRKIEFQIQNLAYQKNIAAKAILLDEEKDLMICAYIEGHHKDVLDQDDLHKLANLLEQLHTIQIDLEPLKLQEHFHTHSTAIREAFDVINGHKVDNVLCHNDLNPKNILFSESVKLIDWEYAAVNDSYFDLAAVSVEFKLSLQEEQYFLQSYFKSNEMISVEKLNAYKTIYSELCKQWFQDYRVK